MLLRALLISLLGLAVAAGPACASDDEIREKEALFILEGFQHWLDLRYQFNDQWSNSGSVNSSTQAFQETYNGSINIDVLNPHLFNAALTFSVGLEQDLNNNAAQGSSFGSGTRYNYQFIGSGLDRSITPFSISTYRNSDTVVSPYSPAYTSLTTGTDFQASLHSSLLPSNVTYSHHTTDNSGGGADSNATSDAFSYNVTHQYGAFSSTGLGVSLSETRGAAIGNSEQVARAYSVDFNNTLRWGGEKYSLMTAAQFSETVDQGVPQRTVNLSETFTDHFGKALDLQVGYLHSATDTLSFGNVPADLLGGTTSTSLDQGEASLTHRLFDSVRTTLKGRYSENHLLDGIEKRYSGEGNLIYTKILPGQNRLNIKLYGTHEVIDNKLGSDTVVVDSQVNGVSQGDVIPFPITFTGTFVDVAAVKTPVTSTQAPLTYINGLDYVFDSFGNVTILRGGNIAKTGADNIVIVYKLHVDPQLSYDNNTFSVNSEMTFLGGQYAIGGSYLSQWMHLNHGSGTSLRDSDMKMVYFSGNLELLNYRVSYSENNVGDLFSRVYEGNVQYTLYCPSALINLVGTERLSQYDATATVRGYTENSTSGSVAAITDLFSIIRVTTSANFFDARSDMRTARDMVSLRVAMVYSLNKITINGDGQTAWTFTGGTVTRNDSLTINIVRYF